MEDMILPTLEANKRLLDKTQHDITVGDELKLAAISTAVMVGATAAVCGALYGIGRLVERRNAKKEAKKAAESVVETTVVEENTTDEKK